MKSVRYALIIFIALGFTHVPDDVTLQYVFKVGDQYTWTQTTGQTIKQSIMGMDQEMQNSFDGQYKLKVVALTSTGAKLDAWFTRLKSSATSPIGIVALDSEGEADKMENKLAKAMTNKKFQLYINKRGEIEKVEGAENLFSGLGNLDIDENKKAELKQNMEQMLGHNALKGSFEQAFVVYPDRRVKNGETWTSKITAPMNFPLAADNVWTLNDFSQATATLTAEGNYITTDKDKQISLPGGFKARIDFRGKQVMKSKVDIVTGWPIRLDINSEIKGKMVLLAGGVVPQDMDVPMNITSKMTLTITKD